MSVKFKPPGSRRRVVVAVAAAMTLCASGPALADTDMTPDVSGILATDLLNPDIPQEEALHWAKVLGKAMFWDQQVGSDGMACASCHYAAGADIRTRNILNPGFLAKIGPDQEPDMTFGAFPAGVADPAAGLSDTDVVGGLSGGRVAGPNFEMTAADFPFQFHNNPGNRNSSMAFFMDDVGSSPGSFDSEQYSTEVSYWQSKEKCKLSVATFHMDAYGKDVPTRAVEPRNTPSTINAAFNFMNFWDGRASNLFNGFDPFGASSTNNDPALRPIVGHKWDLSYADEPLLINNASLASQAVGPPTSNLEMSCNGRMWNFIGAKLLADHTHPLAGQKVSIDDSILGPYSAAGQPYAKSTVTGLAPGYTYADLLIKAFNPKYWGGYGFYKVQKDGDGVPHLVQTSRKYGFNQAELNFSIFFGVSVMLYEQELISDKNKFGDAENSGCVNSNVPNASIPGAFGPIVNKEAFGCVDTGALSDIEADGAFLFYSGGLIGPLPSNGWYDPDTWGTADDSRLVAANFAAQAAPTDPGETGVGGRCNGCHVGDLLTTPATVTADNPTIFGQSTNILAFGGPTTGLGWHNIGGRPVNRDLGSADLNPYGDPSSHTLWAKRWLMGEASKPPFYNLGDTIADNMPLICRHFPSYDGCPAPAFPPGAPAGTTPAADLVISDVIGSMKTPSLNNVALTPPYFSYGGYADFITAIGFYARGGNRRDLDAEVGCPTDGLGELTIRNDSSGTGLNGDSFPVDLSTDCKGSNVISAITALNLSLVDLCPRDPADTDPSDGLDPDPTCDFAQPVNVEIFPGFVIPQPNKGALYGLVALGEYLKTLTDERVRCDAAPFDHPEIYLGHGHDDYGKDIVARLPEVGSLGYDAEGMPQFCLPNAGNLFADGMQNRVDPAVAN